MPAYKSFARGIHVSRYQKVDWSLVMPHVDFVIAKCSDGPAWKDPEFVSTVQACYDYDKPCLAFHYYDGDYYPALQFSFSDDSKWVAPAHDLQLQNMIESLTHKRIYGLAVDIEETTNRTVMPSWMSKGAKVFTGRAGDYMRDTRPGKPTLVYTRQSYINEYAPGMNDWVHNYDQWVCQPKAYDFQTLTWEQLESRIPADTWRVNPMGAGKTWKFWQWQIDRFVLPGIYTNDTRKAPRTICTELFNGTVADLHQYLGFVLGQKPEVKPEPKVPQLPTRQVKSNVSQLEIRAQANPRSQSLGKRSPGEVIAIDDFDIANGYTWVHDARGWSAVGPNWWVE